ncbi:MAG: hypothetical protein J1F25_01145 [Prevotellaceae bacterium]|nr:hypothetical protein [Prevotellaceae bacterium]
MSDTEVKKENGLVRFIVSFLWLALAIGTDIVFFMTNGFLYGGVASFVLFLITFLVPYLRKKGTLTRWIGILALLDAGWLLYLHFGAQG